MQNFSTDSPSQSLHSEFPFEGPEKKLYVSFFESPSPGLRALKNHHINSILRAATCTVLSVKSNNTTDAYLLSESSMFVSDYHITIKTCGTTTLLRALPVLIRIALDTLGLHLAFVQFSRVPYRFPAAQRYPHDSFNNEVAYLDHFLATKGAVLEPYYPQSRWHCYFAHVSTDFLLPAPTDTHADLRQKHLPHSPSFNYYPPSQTLELSMFDLHPSVMKRYVFHHKPSVIGADKPLNGTTSTTGILRLLPNNCIIDAHNFQPCGYSMNALSNHSYYTIHVSPEPKSSYVSFETTDSQRSLPSLIAAVVRLFQPTRFTVSLISHARPKSSGSISSHLSWPLVYKLLSGDYSIMSKPFKYDRGTPSPSMASVACFRKVSTNMHSPQIEHNWLPAADELNRAHAHLLTVAKKHQASFTHDFDSWSSSELPLIARNSHNPRFVINLTNITDNWHALCQCKAPHHLILRYAVRHNPDKAILTLLSGLEHVQFEVVDAWEIDLLASLGISRRRIAAVTLVPTSSLINRLSKIGIFAVFDILPAHTVAALTAASVSAEIRIPYGTFDPFLDILKYLTSARIPVSSIAIEKDPDSLKQDGEQIEHVVKSTEKLQFLLRKELPNKYEDIVIHLAEQWWPADCFNQPVKENPLVASIISHSCYNRDWGVDASRFLLSGSIYLLTRIIGTRAHQISALHGNKESTTHYSYYLNDGIYGSLAAKVINDQHTFSSSSSSVLQYPWTDPVALLAGDARSTYSTTPGEERTKVLSNSTLFGPTCDALDRIWDGSLPVMRVGDNLLFSDLGTASAACSTTFNGLSQNLDVTYITSLPLFRGDDNFVQYLSQRSEIVVEPQ